MSLFNLASLAAHLCSGVGARPYDSSQEQRNNEKILKEALLTMESIRNVATKACCSKNYLQPFLATRLRLSGLKCMWKRVFTIGSIGS